MIAITTEDRLRPLLERTADRLEMWAALYLLQHREWAETGKPFLAAGAWSLYSNRFYRAEAIRRALEKGA